MYTVLFCTFVGSNVRLYIGTPLKMYAFSSCCKIPLMTLHDSGYMRFLSIEEVRCVLFVDGFLNFVTRKTVIIFVIL